MQIAHRAQRSSLTSNIRRARYARATGARFSWARQSFWGVETLYLKLAGQAVSGFATVILLELIIGSFLMISLGIIGEYLARIYEEVKGRPRYIVAESIESGLHSRQR